MKSWDLTNTFDQRYWSIFTMIFSPWGASSGGLARAGLRHEDHDVMNSDEVLVNKDSTSNANAPPVNNGKRLNPILLDADETRI